MPNPPESPAERAAQLVRKAQGEYPRMQIEPDIIYGPPPNSCVRPDIKYIVNGHPGLPPVTALETIIASSIGSTKTKEEETEKQKRKRDLYRQVGEAMRERNNRP